jgi:ribonuclease BN (tRNA processing enzyme)
MSSLTFLGTGGARVLVFKQLLASGGLWLELEGVRFHVDPGPGALLQALTRKLDPTKLDAILLSHRHLDHSSDINAMIEAMTTGGFHRRGAVFAPADAFADDPVILRYLRGYVDRTVTLEEGGTYRVGEIEFRTPVRHQHPGQVFGFVFQAEGQRLCYVSDTRYFPELADHYRGDLLIVNTVFLEPRPEIAHLSIPEAGELIAAVRPRLAIITHFGLTVWRARPWELAEKLSQQTGVMVKAARDGMKVELPV